MPVTMPDIPKSPPIPRVAKPEVIPAAERPITEPDIYIAASGVPTAAAFMLSLFIFSTISESVVSSCKTALSFNIACLTIPLSSSVIFIFGKILLRNSNWSLNFSLELECMLTKSLYKDMCRFLNCPAGALVSIILSSSSTASISSG